VISESIRRAVAVVGCQRTGTTLAGQMLGSLPGTFLLDEDDGVYPWVNAIWREEPDPELEQAMLEQADTKYVESRLSRTDGSLTLRDGCEVLVLKVPQLTVLASRVAAVASAVSVVYPVRDPRAAVASMLAQFRNLERLMEGQLTWLPPDLHDRFAVEVDIMRSDQPAHRRLAALWLIKSQLHDTFEAVGLEPFTFRYEDLVGQPEVTARALCEAIGEPFSDACLQHHRTLVGRAPGRTERGRSVDRRSRDQWRRSLTPTQAADVWSLTGQLAARFGYDE
jgi:hypothetical protein